MNCGKAETRTDVVVIGVVLTQKNELWQSNYTPAALEALVVLTQKNELWQSRLRDLYYIPKGNAIAPI